MYVVNLNPASQKFMVGKIELHMGCAVQDMWQEHAVSALQNYAIEMIHHDL